MIPPKSYEKSPRRLSGEGSRSRDLGVVVYAKASRRPSIRTARRTLTRTTRRDCIVDGLYYGSRGVSTGQTSTSFDPLASNHSVGAAEQGAVRNAEYASLAAVAAGESERMHVYGTGPKRRWYDALGRGAQRALDPLHAPGRRRQRPQGVDASLVARCYRPADGGS